MDAGVVDQDVELAEMAQRRIEQPLDLHDLANVRPNGKGTASGLPNFIDNRLGLVLTGRVVDYHGGPVLGQALSDGRPNAL